MNTQSTLKVITQGEYKYVYIYFKHKSQQIRINTGLYYDPKFMTKDLLYNSKMKDYQILNDRVKVLKGKVDDYIRWVLGSRLRTLSKDECMKFVYSGEQSYYTYYYKVNQEQEKERVKKEPKNVTDYLKVFYQFKKSQLNNRASDKGYLTMVNSLYDFQSYYNTELTFDLMNSEDFMVKYRNFLSEKLKKKKYLTKGGLNDNTINKRFSCLKTFFTWLEDKEIYRFKDRVHNFKVPKYENTIVVLDKDEISKLLEQEIEDKTWIKIRDVFVANCFMGLRISDLKTLTKRDFIQDGDGDYYLIKENKKTGFSCEISIQNTCRRILEKYDFELPKFSDQHFNRELKNLLKEYNLFPETVVKRRRVLKQNVNKESLKRDLISSHTCRRTFITLGLSNNVPINTLMLATGHKQISTLQKYMKKIPDKASLKRIDLNHTDISSN